MNPSCAWRRSRWGRGVLGLAMVLALAVSSRAEDLVFYPRDPTETGNGAPRLVVPDPEAHDGTAQAAVPGQSKPGSSTCSLYAYARPAPEGRAR